RSGIRFYPSSMRSQSEETRTGLFGSLSRALPSPGCSQRVLEGNGDVAQEGEMPGDWSQQLYHPPSRRVDHGERCHTVRKPGRIPSLPLPERAAEILSKAGNPSRGL